MKTINLLTALSIVAFSLSAQAKPHHMPDEMKAKLEAMTPEQREEFHTARKAEWQAMDDAEKLKMIEEKREAQRKEMDAKWNAMDDAEKIKHVEGRMKHDGKRSRPMGEKKE